MGKVLGTASSWEAEAADLFPVLRNRLAQKRSATVGTSRMPPKIHMIGAWSPGNL